MVQAAQFPLHLQSLLLHSPLQQNNRRVFSPHRFFAAPSPFSRSLPPNWAPAAPGAAPASAGGSSSDDGTLQRGAADPCSSASRIVNEIRSSSEATTTMAFGFNASNNTMTGGAGNINAGPDLETIQTEVSSNIFVAWLLNLLQYFFFFFLLLSFC
jgi:hypothetical protein